MQQARHVRKGEAICIPRFPFSVRRTPRFFFLPPPQNERGETVTKTLPQGVERAVRGYCEDYSRRRAEIAKGALPPETIGHYMILNAKIDDAIASCCEAAFCEDIREDIASCTGHRFTKLYYLAPATYKDRKRKSKLAIARALHLI